MNANFLETKKECIFVLSNFEFLVSRFIEGIAIRYTGNNLAFALIIIIFRRTGFQLGNVYVVVLGTARQPSYQV